MITRLSSSAPWGIQGFLVEVEVDSGLGIPHLALVGLPDQAVKESRDRVRSAIRNAGFNFPLKRVTVNLAPADLKKEGPAFDLAIALGILSTEGHLKPEMLTDILAVGELGLDGKVRAVKGVIQAAMLARRLEKRLLFARENLSELALLEGTDHQPELLPVSSLEEAVKILEGQKAPGAFEFPQEEMKLFDMPDLKDVRGQKAARRALEIAVAGGHNLLFIGPPGTGKTMLARRIPGILPRLSRREALEIAMVYGVSDEPGRTGLILRERPFRSPHHSLSTASLIGGGTVPKPGEISLAHHGVLFLDELSEFRKDALESLRTPLEDKRVLISRVSGALEYPAQFILVGASNPCRCGYFSSRFRSCRCTLAQLEQFRQRLSGPLIDRLDLQVEVSEVDWEDLRSKTTEESSEVVRERVERAREVQRRRYREFDFATNGAMNERALAIFCSLDEETEEVLRRSLAELGLSARAHARVLKIARTIADLGGSEEIRLEDLREAVQYRVLDRQFIQVA